MDARPTAPPERLHPNPQLARAGWISLEGPWQAALEELGQVQDDPRRVRWDRTIQVPFAPETPASGIEHKGMLAGCWYRRAFHAPPMEDGQRLMLHFGAVDYEATVWLNAQRVAWHEGGYTPFVCDITDQLADEGQQELVVHAVDDPLDLAKPRGKQDWLKEPHSIWYPRTTGIWQPVWLETVGRAWLSQVHWTADLESFTLKLEATVAGRLEDGLRLRVRLHKDDDLEIRDECQVVAGEVVRGIALPDPGIGDGRDRWLWCPERPTLIAVELELVDAGGRRLDAVTGYTAMRSVDTRAGRVFLNNRPRYLRMVLDQGYWPRSGLTPPDDQAARRDVELILALGFNGARAHQRIPDPRYLYWADVLGLLVWEEMPSAYRFSEESVNRLARQWAEAIRRDRGHPCVIVWVPLNESWGVPDLLTSGAQRHAARALYHLTKALDPTRPVSGNDGWEMDRTDIIAIHDYDHSAPRLAARYGGPDAARRFLAGELPAKRVLLLERAAYSGQPIMLTEFGGIALNEPGAWGYSRAANGPDLLSRYRELVAAAAGLPAMAGFCYTQFSDTYQEANGLLRADRAPKAPLEKLREATLTAPASGG